MPKAIRKGVDNSTGHDCYPPRPASEGSPDTFINDIPSVRLTDTYFPHACPNSSSHGGNASEGSPDTFVNDLAIHRAGDAISCGDFASNGSPDTFINSLGGGGGMLDNNIPYTRGGQTPPLGANPNPPTQYYQENTTATVIIHETDDEHTAVPSLPAGTSEVRMSPSETDEQQPPPIQPQPQDCSNVELLPDNYNWANDPSYTAFTDFANSFQLSSLLLKDLCFCAVSYYEFNSNVNQNSGLTQKEILRNLCFLVKTIIEPLTTLYGSDFIITSGFRNKSDTSQHSKGQAIDIQFPNFHNTSNTGQLYYDTAKEIRDNINFDQMILEWYGRNPWIHISANPLGHRNQVLTQVSPGSYQPGLILLKHY